MTNETDYTFRNILYIILIVIVFLTIIAYTSSEANKQSEINKQSDIQPYIEMIDKLEQHKFYLKETNVDSLISGKISGSHLFIAGSIYGEITENKYLTVVYFDDDTIIDNTTGVYKITKFDLESIEIVTIPKNETPYYKYVDNTYLYLYMTRYCEIVVGKPRLFLPDGWTILNNN